MGLITIYSGAIRFVLLAFEILKGKLVLFTNDVERLTFSVSHEHIFHEKVMYRDTTTGNKTE